MLPKITRVSGIIWAVGLLIVLAISVTSGCTVDEDSIENKICDPTRSDVDKTCIRGYTCSCVGTACVCKAKATLTGGEATSGELNEASDTDRTVIQATEAEESRALLRKLGFYR